MQSKLKINFMCKFAVFFLSFLLVGCESFYGIRRQAFLCEMPSMEQIKERIDKYEELNEVNFSVVKLSESRSLYFLNGEEGVLYRIDYSGGELVSGCLEIEKRGDLIKYEQYLASFRPLSDEMIEASMLVMEKIEADLIYDCRLLNFNGSVKVLVRRKCSSSEYEKIYKPTGQPIVTKRFQ